MPPPFFRYGGARRLALLAVFAAALLPAHAQPAAMNIDVHTRRPEFTMQGGIGASWHALSREQPLHNERYRYPIREENPRGSAYGGNPPVSDGAAWKALYRHASWLGMDWLRVEISQQMYQPSAEHFEWDNDEMQALYHILDWAEASGADVFLQQMYTGVEWNAYPGVHPMLSAPRDLKPYAEGVAALLDHLVHRKRYTCIRWFCIANEPPGGTWGYWWEAGDAAPPTLASALAAVRAALDRKGVGVPLSGPDWTDLPPLDTAAIDFDAHIGAYDIHSYQGMDAERVHTLAAWAEWAAARGKPLFLSEMGNMQLGWGADNPAPKSWDAALSNAEAIVRGIQAGVGAFNRWSFVNRGDLDGQWQLVHTWDRDRKTYAAEITAEPTAFVGYGLMTRFAAKHSSRLAQTLTEQRPDVLTTTLLSPRGHLTTFLINLGADEAPVALAYADLPEPRAFYKYQADAARAANPDYRPAPAPLGALGAEPLRETLPPRSITVLTTHHLQAGEPGVTAE